MVFTVFFLFVATYVPSVIMYTFERGTFDDALGCYRAEHEDECTPFQNILESMYWGVTTITTVGYGDVVPSTNTGRVISALTMVCGVISFAIPVSMVCAAFDSAVHFTKD